jgi:hypothetical protein
MTHAKPLCCNTRRVMVARHHGWEGASPGLLARVFGVSVQRATAICAERCGACGRAICGCTDAAWASNPSASDASTDANLAGGGHSVPRALGVAAA